MITEKLEKHICDTIKEWQIKIGYQKENMKLYYPKESLINLLELPKETNISQLYQELDKFAKTVEPRLKETSYSNQEERFCIEVSADGCEFIKNHLPDSPFLEDFLKVITGKNQCIEDLRTCFSKYENNFHEEDKTKEGLGHVFWFNHPEIDDYIYCVESDEFGLTYHRFIREDYQQLANLPHQHHHA